jgi:hypothetical protein
MKARRKEKEKTGSPKIGMVLSLPVKNYHKIFRRKPLNNKFTEVIQLVDALLGAGGELEESYYSQGEQFLRYRIDGVRVTAIVSDSEEEEET